MTGGRAQPSPYLRTDQRRPIVTTLAPSHPLEPLDTETQMKVGILQFFGWRDRSVPLNSVYEMALERFSIMDETGYDAVWLAEHHFSSFSVCPSVHMMGTMAAARTKRLRIGMAVSLAPFYNPLRLAEEVALLDVLSGGRVNWGAGRGFERSEFAAFGIPGEESAPRFHETVEIVLKAWTNQRLTHHGHFFQYDDVEVLPKPLQTPPSRPAGGAPPTAGGAPRRRPRRSGWRRHPRRRSTGRRARATRS